MSSETELAKIPVILIGSSGVGKTCLINRLISGKYEESPQTVGLQFVPKNITNEKEKLVTLEIYDTAGQEKFKEAIPPVYYHNAKVAIVCFYYDNSIKDLHSEVDKHIANIHNKNLGCKIILAATKSDKYGDELPNVVSFMDEFEYDYIIGKFITSSLEGTAVEDLFTRAASIDTETIMIKIDSKQDEDNKKKCC